MGLGEKLRTARMNLKMTTSQVASATCMKIQIVEAIEEEDFSKIAAPIYAKGFIRLYAEQVGVNPTPLIDEYVARYVEQPAPESRPPTAVNEGMEKDGKSISHEEPPPVPIRAMPPAPASYLDDEPELPDADGLEIELPSVEPEAAEDLDLIPRQADEVTEEEPDDIDDLFTRPPESSVPVPKKEKTPRPDWGAKLSELFARIKGIIVKECLEPCGELCVKSVQGVREGAAKFKQNIIGSDVTGKIDQLKTKFREKGTASPVGITAAVAALVLVVVLLISCLMKEQENKPDETPPPEPDPTAAPENVEPALPPPSPYWD